MFFVIDTAQNHLAELFFLQVLFIKNLHHKTTEADLVSLFIRFQSKSGSRIIFRLMKGKMNGQAFVTLPGDMCCQVVVVISSAA